MPVMAPRRRTGSGMSKWKPRCLAGGTVPTNVRPVSANVPLPGTAASGGGVTVAGVEKSSGGATLDGPPVKVSIGNGAVSGTPPSITESPVPGAAAWSGTYASASGLASALAPVGLVAASTSTRSMTPSWVGNDAGIVHLIVFPVLVGVPVTATFASKVGRVDQSPFWTAAQSFVAGDTTTVALV